jgi:hypothetical protein
LRGDGSAPESKCSRKYDRCKFHGCSPLSSKVDFTIGSEHGIGRLKERSDHALFQIDATVGPGAALTHYKLSETDLGPQSGLAEGVIRHPQLILQAKHPG